MAQSSCAEVTLLLDNKFLQCERLLFHPMQSDFTTALAPDQLTAFLDRAAPSRYAFIDLASKEPVVLPKGQSLNTSAKATLATSPTSENLPKEDAGWWTPP